MQLFLVAGESSGDMVASNLIRGLRHRFPLLRYTGIGGPLMEKEGNFTSLVPFSQLSHLGFSAVIKRLPSLWNLLNHSVKAVHASGSIGLLTVDCPEFCLRLSKRVHGMPRIHCIPPAVWAWRPGRAKRLQEKTDLALSLFPFEAPYFSHMPHAFVGHPAMERPRGDAHRFWEKHGPKRPLLCLLPGSREREILHFLPTFLEVARRLKKEDPSLLAVIVATPTLYPLVRRMAPNEPIFTDEGEKSDIFSAATVALAASGTVSLELGFHETPMVIGYRVPRPTEWILRRLLTVRSVALINLIAETPFVPECLQDRFVPDILYQEVLTLMRSDQQRLLQQQGSRKAIATLRAEKPFSVLAAQVIGDFLQLEGATY